MPPALSTRCAPPRCTTNRNALLIALISMLALVASCGSSRLTPATPAPQSDTGQIWYQPTPRPVIDTSTQLANVSNLPGADGYAAVALHPTERWAALAWVNLPPDSDRGTVFVRIQDAATGEWRTGTSISAAPVSFSQHVDIAIGFDRRIHVVWSQQDGPHYRRSDDYGATWSPPEPLRVPNSLEGALYPRIAVDRSNRLHVVFASGTGEVDTFHAVYQTRRADANPGSVWQVSTQLFPGRKHRSFRIAVIGRGSAGDSLVVAGGCNAGCGGAQPVLAMRELPAGNWRSVTLPGAATLVGAINWIDLDSFIDQHQQPRLCVSWGFYARSGNFVACSRDAGTNWSSPSPVITTPAPAGDDFHASDTGSLPELLYEPTTGRLMSVAIYRQAGTPTASYPIYSHRDLDDSRWTPHLTGPYADHEPPLRLFPATSRNLADWNGAFNVAWAGTGLALAAWTEQDAGENYEIYAGFFNPASLLTREGEPPFVPTERPIPARVPTSYPEPTKRIHPLPTPWNGLPQARRLAYFAEAPTDATSIGTIATRFGEIVLTHGEEAYRDELRAAGYRGAITRILLANEIHVPATCTAQPLPNQVASAPGDACWITANAPAWFLHDAQGQPICHLQDDERFCFMDPAQVGWQAYWFRKMEEYQAGWDGLTLAGVDGGLRRIGTTSSVYGADDAAYRTAVVSFLQAIAASRTPGQALYAQIVAGDDPVVWTHYAAHVTGLLIEPWAVGVELEQLNVAQWTSDLALSEQLLSAGRRTILVTHGRRTDTRRQRFAYASYLLVAADGASFRYTHPRAYREVWLYSTYQADLGVPRGPRYQVGNLWKRDYTRGHVSVDPTHHTATIEVLP